LADRLQKGLTKRKYEVVLFNSAKNNLTDAIQFSPHIVHSFNADKPYQWIKNFRNQHQVPWVITLTGTDYNSWIGIKNTPSHIKESVKKADALVVFHEEASQKLCAYIPHLINKIHVIPQGISSLGKDHNVLSVRKKYSIIPDHIVFLMASSIRPVKNIQYAIKAFYKVEREVPNVTLLHVGPIFDREEAKRVFNLSKKLKYFRHPGEIPHIQIHELMGAVDVFLNTSFHEGMSCAILEAMAEGLPILASSEAGNRSLVKDGINGLLFHWITVKY
jgi:glycosyltransferase involved in cell wall biosynthesis